MTQERNELCPWVFMVAVFLFSVLSAGAFQEGDWNKQITQLSILGQSQASDYVLGPGDLIEVKVYGVDDFAEIVRISSSGTITLPYLGRLETSGLTAAQLEDRVAREIVGKKLIKNPQASVFVREYRSQPVFVLGAVRQPGQYMMTQQLQLIDALALAGGLDLGRAASYALLQRRDPSGDSPAAQTLDSVADHEADPAETTPGNDGITIKVDLKELLEGGNISLNVPIKGGDVIQVPERELALFYIIGEVNRPGAYELDGGEPLLLSQALAWAGGPRPTAKASNGMLLRYDQGERKEIAIDFDEIIKGKKPDFQVEAEDVIFIPGSKVKTIGYGLLGGIPGAITGAGTAVIYRPR